MSTETLWLILAVEIVIVVFSVRFLVIAYQRSHCTNEDLEEEFTDDELEFDEKYPALSVLEDLTIIAIPLFSVAAFADLLFQIFVTAAGPFFGANFVEAQDFIYLFP